jgi:DNA-binding CsgD family transcriptional regulator
MSGSKRIVRLTWIEVEALCFAANGYTTREIAAEVGVSYESVKSRLARAMRKLGAVSTTQAVALALATGQMPASAVQVTPAARRSARDALRASTHKR